MKKSDTCDGCENLKILFRSINEPSREICLMQKECIKNGERTLYKLKENSWQINSIILLSITLNFYRGGQVCKPTALPHKRWGNKSKE